MADISYTRTTWADGAEGGTAIDATKLNNIEQGIVDTVAAIGPNDTTEDGTLKAQIDENTSAIETLQESVDKFSLTNAAQSVSFYSSSSHESRVDIANTDGSTSYFIMDVPNNRLVLRIIDSGGTRIYNKAVTLS